VHELREMRNGRPFFPMPFCRQTFDASAITFSHTNRTGAILGIKFGGRDDFYFAQNLIHDSKKKTGVLSVGDPLTVFT